ncbi:MAG: TetR/AcrR family transcriptional regulator [Nitrospiraceae bacterium]|nr:MAG: TetR/AcrR family transcriptional regulator [Nitrospiraceae bacterium]
MSRPDKKQKILDAAEYLFAREGYRGTSLRAITGKAKVNLASVNYHFGSKTSLLEAVIRRRILPLNQLRMKRLEQVRGKALKAGKRPDVKAVLLAFIEPTLLFMESGPGAKNFVTFIGRSFTDPDDTVRKVFLRFIKQIFQLLFETLCDALPNHRRDIIFWRLHFTMGALFHTMHVCGNITVGPRDIHTNIDSHSLINQIIPFVTAGVKAS